MASFTSYVDSVDKYEAIICANFTGGDSSYSNKRACEFTCNGSTDVFDSLNTGGSSSSFVLWATGLDSGTTYYYTARLGYYTDAACTNVVWTSYTTSGSFTTKTDSICYIYTNGTWTPATPYIYINGSWEPAEAHIYANGGWNP